MRYKGWTFFAACMRERLEGWCDSPSEKKVSWLVYQWLAQGKLSRFYICHVCLWAHPSPGVQLSPFELTWRDCIGVRPQDCFQDDVIHPPCLSSEWLIKSYVWLSVSDWRHSTSDSFLFVREEFARSGWFFRFLFIYWLNISEVAVRMTG